MVSVNELGLDEDIEDWLDKLEDAILAKHDRSDKLAYHQTTTKESSCCRENSVCKS